jgi:hypothetical protein
VPGAPDVFALGDCATIEGMDLPATAQVAQQKGITCDLLRVTFASVMLIIMLILMNS